MCGVTRAVPIVFVLVVWTLTTHGKFSDSGDEPHYLMVAESLLADRDLDLADNYANGDGRWFGADTLEAGPHARLTRTGASWSAHDVGLPLLILPVYAVATRASLGVPDSVLRRIRQPRGLFAYSLVSLALVALTAWGLTLFVAGLARHVPATHAALVGLVLGLSPPVLSHAFLVFPETPAFVVVCAFIWLCCLRPDELSKKRVALVVMAIGCLPWLHRKFSFFVFGLILVLLHRLWAWFVAQRASTRVLLVAAVVMPQIVLHVWTLNAWGNVGGPQMLDRVPFFLDGVQRGALGMLVDRERGLLGYAPIYMLVPACWGLAWRRSRGLLIPVVLLFLPMASFAVWGAGFSPAARYLVPLVPIFASPAASAFANRAIRIAAVPLLLFQGAIVAIVWNYPRALWPKEQGTNEALERLPVLGAAYERILPSLLTGDPVLRGWLVVAGIALATAALVRIARRS